MTAVSVEAFAGLNLVDDASTVGWGGAIDLLDVDVAGRGRLRNRPGYSQLVTTTAASSKVFYDDENDYLLSLEGTNLRAYDSSFAATDTQANMAGVADFVVYNTDTARFVYIVTTGAAGLISWDGASFTSTGALTGTHLAVTPWDNRLVRANTTTNPNRVMFSDPGAPTTFGANNFEDLAPGGGEIMAVRTWGNLVFVFKKDHYFAFYGTGIDGSGNPVFNWRAIESGGVGVLFSQAAVAGREGVYFVAYDGIYVTRGSFPVKISRAIDPLFTAESMPFYAGSSMNLGSSFHISYSGECLFVSYTEAGTGNRRVLVYHVPSETWTVYSLPAFGMAPYQGQGIVFSASSGSALHYHPFDDAAGSYTTDNGAAITGRYRTGFFSPTQDYRQVQVRSLSLHGTGSVTVKGAKDWASTLDSGTAVTLGTSPAIAEGIYNNPAWGYQGKNFSVQVGGTGAWTLNRFQAHVEDGRDDQSK